MPENTNIDESPTDGINAGPGYAEDPDEKMDEEVTEKLQEQINEDNDGQPSKEDLDDITDKARENAYHFFVVHESTGKVEVLTTVQPGVVSYAFDPDRVTPRDLRYILEATYDGAGIDDRTAVQVIMKPHAGIKRAKIWLDIRNRSDIEIGIMELWRYNK